MRLDQDWEDASARAVDTVPSRNMRIQNHKWQDELQVQRSLPLRAAVDAVEILRAMLQLPLVQAAIDGDDIAANFLLRSARTILANETLPPCKLIDRLWEPEA